MFQLKRIKTIKLKSSIMSPNIGINTKAIEFLIPQDRITFIWLKKTVNKILIL